MNSKQSYARESVSLTRLRNSWFIEPLIESVLNPLVHRRDQHNLLPSPVS